MNNWFRSIGRGGGLQTRAALKRQISDLRGALDDLHEELVACRRRLDLLENRSNADERRLRNVEAEHRKLSDEIEAAGDSMKMARLEVARVAKQSALDEEQSRKAILGIMEQLARLQPGPAPDPIATPAELSRRGDPAQLGHGHG